MEVVGSSPIKAPRYFPEQETLPLLLSTGWFEERIRAWCHKRTKINWEIMENWLKCQISPPPPLNIVKIKTKPKKRTAMLLIFLHLNLEFEALNKSYTHLSHLLSLYSYICLSIRLFCIKLIQNILAWEQKRKTKISFVLQCQHLVIINHFKRICTVLSYTATLYALKMWYIFHKVILIRDYLPHAGFRIVLTIG